MRYKLREYGLIYNLRRRFYSFRSLKYCPGRRRSSSSRTPPIFPGVPDPLTYSSGRPQPDLAWNRTRNPVNRKACNIPLYHTGSSEYGLTKLNFHTVLESHYLLLSKFLRNFIDERLCHSVWWNFSHNQTPGVFLITPQFETNLLIMITS